MSPQELSRAVAVAVEDQGIVDITHSQGYQESELTQQHVTIMNSRESIYHLHYLTFPSKKGGFPFFPPEHLLTILRTVLCYTPLLEMLL